MYKTTIFMFAAVFCVTGWACKQQKPQPGFSKRHANTFTVKGSVRKINIHPETPHFPEYEGKKEFMTYCSLCHSLLYISMQPDFPRKTWEAEVNKMIVKYNAPIDSAIAKKIVEYLVRIKSET